MLSLNDCFRKIHWPANVISILGLQFNFSCSMFSQLWFHSNHAHNFKATNSRNNEKHLNYKDKRVKVNYSPNQNNSAISEKIWSQLLHRRTKCGIYYLQRWFHTKTLSTYSWKKEETVCLYKCVCISKRQVLRFKNDPT